MLVSLCWCVLIVISLSWESPSDSWSQTRPHLTHLGFLLRLRSLIAWQQALARTCDLPALLAWVQPFLLSTHYTFTNRWRWAVSFLLYHMSILISFYATIYFNLLINAWDWCGHRVTCLWWVRIRDQSQSCTSSHIWQQFILIMQMGGAAPQHRMEEQC